jgi:hypothetical protein
MTSGATAGGETAAANWPSGETARGETAAANRPRRNVIDPNFYFQGLCQTKSTTESIYIFVLLSPARYWVSQSQYFSFRYFSIHILLLNYLTALFSSFVEPSKADILD